MLGNSALDSEARPAGYHCPECRQSWPPGEAPAGYCDRCPDRVELDDGMLEANLSETCTRDVDKQDDVLHEAAIEEVAGDENGARASHVQAERPDEEVFQVGVQPSDPESFQSQLAESTGSQTSPDESCRGCSCTSADQINHRNDDSDEFVGSPSEFLIETAVAEEVKQFFSTTFQFSNISTPSSCSSASIAGTAGSSSSSSSSAPSTSASSGSTPGGSVYEVNVKLIDGTTTKIELSSEMSGIDLKRLILEKMSVAVERQRLISRGRVIQDTDLVGQHITASGQTIHLVQRPVPTGNEGSSSQSSQNVEQDGPQIRIQATGGEVPIQAELSEILGAMLGNVGRGVGMGAVVHTTPLLRVPRPGLGNPQPATGSNAPSNAPNIVHALGGSLGSSPLSSLLLPGPTAGNRQTPPTPPTPPLQLQRGWLSRAVLFAALLVTLLLVAMPLMAWCIVQIESNYVLGFPPWHIWALGFHLLGLVLGLPSVYLAFRSRSPLRGLRALLTQTDGGGLDSNQLAQAIAAMTLQPQQMLFSQGVGHVVTTLETEGFPPAAPEESGDQHTSSQTFSFGATANEAPIPQTGAQVQHGALPWQDLSRFNEQTFSLLGRTGSQRQLPPARMPYGELCSYLSNLQVATNQLGAGIGDLQTNFLEGAGMSPEQLRNLATTMEAAARSLSSTAVALRGENREGGSS